MKSEQRQTRVWLSLSPEDAARRLRERVDGVGLAECFGLWGASPLVGQVGERSFWFQVRPGGYADPLLRGELSPCGFGSVAQVSLERHPLWPFLAIMVAFPLIALLFGEAWIVLTGSVAVTPSVLLVMLLRRGASKKGEMIWSYFKDIFHDVVLELEQAA